MSALAEIRRRIESTGALISQYEIAIAREPQTAPPSLHVNIRALEKLLHRLDDEFQEIALSQGLEVYRYQLLNENDHPPLMGVAEAWAHFQKFFTAVYGALKQSKSEKKRVEPSSIPELGYGYTFAGSIGVVITLPREATNLIGESTLDNTSETVFDLLESKNLNATARRLGPRPIEALHEWVDIHSRNHFGMGLEWRPNNVVRRYTELGYQQLDALKQVIVDTETRSSTTLTGELREVDLDAKTFRFRADDGKVIEGTYKDAITPEHATSLPARHTATIVTITKIIVLAKEPSTSIHLDKLETLT